MVQLGLCRFEHLYCESVALVAVENVHIVWIREKHVDLVITFRLSSTIDSDKATS